MDIPYFDSEMDEIITSRQILTTYQLVVDDSTEWNSRAKSSASAVQYDPVEIACQARGDLHPQPDVTLLKSGMDVTSLQNAHYMVMSQNQTRLHIPSFDVDHHGDYECRARMASGRYHAKRLHIALDTKKLKGGENDIPCNEESSDSFCLHGGQCFIQMGQGVKSSGSIYCRCQPGFVGKHCDMRNSLVEVEKSYKPWIERPGNEIKAVGGCLAVSLISLVLLLLVFFLYVKKRRYSAIRRRSESMGTSTSPSLTFSQYSFICAKCGAAAPAHLAANYNWLDGGSRTKTEAAIAVTGAVMAPLRALSLHNPWKPYNKVVHIGKNLTNDMMMATKTADDAALESLLGTTSTNTPCDSRKTSSEHTLQTSFGDSTTPSSPV